MDEQQNLPDESWTSYLPLVMLALVSLFAACALCWGNEFSMSNFMHYFMGFVLCQFSLLKLFDLKGFQEGFRKYDLIASRFPIYGLVYPFLELLLGLGYLSFALPIITYIATIVILGVGAVGVFVALSRGLDVHCACMGTALHVPLSTVSLTEDIVMILMALFLLFMH